MLLFKHYCCKACKQSRVESIGCRPVGDSVRVRVFSGEMLYSFRIGND